MRQNTFSINAQNLRVLKTIITSMFKNGFLFTA